jgi:hypothetical protein
MSRSIKEELDQLREARSSGIPAQGVKEFILALAEKNQIAYSRTFADEWADNVTRLAGDDVRPDPVKDILVALKRAGMLTSDEMILLLVDYLREQKDVRSL